MTSDEQIPEPEFPGFGTLCEEQQDWILRHVFFRLALGPTKPEAAETFRSILEQAGNKPALQLFKESGLTKFRNLDLSSTGENVDLGDVVDLAEGHSKETARMTLTLWIQIVNVWVQKGLAVQERLDERTDEEKEKYDELVKELIKDPE
jgi:hypothetical protein